MHSLGNISKSQAKHEKKQEIMIVAKRGFSYSYYDVQSGIYPKMNEILQGVFEFDEIMNASNNKCNT